MEIAICQLLLGRKAEALGTLGVLEGASGSADSAPDSGILEFIQVCCPYSTDDPLGGILPQRATRLVACIEVSLEMQRVNLIPGIMGLQGHASEGGDLTPGLTAMAQSWVEDVALPSFRGGGASLAPLDTWFENPQVKIYIMVRPSAPPKALPRYRLALRSLNATLKPQA